MNLPLTPEKVQKANFQLFYSSTFATMLEYLVKIGSALLDISQPKKEKLKITKNYTLLYLLYITIVQRS